MLTVPLFKKGGNVPIGWKLSTLGDSLDELYRYPTYYGIKYVAKGVPEVRGELIKDHGVLESREDAYRYIDSKTAALFPRVRLEAQDFVLSVRGTMGKVGMVPKQLSGGVITANLVRLKFNTSLIWPKWVRHFLLSPLFKDALETVASATTIKTVQIPKLRSIVLLRPSLREQIQIAKILDTIDEAIQKTEQLIAKLKAMKQGLLHDLLTRGIDENGELRDPIAHPEQFKDSPLGRIPKDWEVKELSWAAVKIQDGTHFSPKSLVGPFRYLTSKNIRFGYLDLSECGWITEREHNAIYSRCDVHYGDVLLTKDGVNTGNATINDLNEPVSLLSSVAFIRCDGLKIDRNFLLQFFLSPVCQQRIRDLMSGNAITRLTLQKIKCFIIPLPTISEQIRIGASATSWDVVMNVEQKYLSKLRLIKKGLMHDLLTGKVRVKFDVSDKKEYDNFGTERK